MAAGANTKIQTEDYSIDKIVTFLKTDQNKILADYGKKVDLLLQQY